MELSADFEIEQTARPDEDTYSSSNGSAAGAEEPEPETDENSDTANEEVISRTGQLEAGSGNVDIVI